MQVGHRFVASGVAVAVVSAVVALPVVTGPAAQVHPVEPVVTQIALQGIDPVGLRASARTRAGRPARRRTSSRRSPVRRRRSAPAGTLAPAVVTAATGTRPFSLVGVDWTGTTPAGTTVQVRVHENGSLERLVAARGRRPTTAPTRPRPRPRACAPAPSRS